MNTPVKSRIEDAGEKLGGARKDAVSGRESHSKVPTPSMLEQLRPRPERWTDLIPTLGAQRAVLCMVTYENLAKSPHKQGWLGQSAETWQQLYLLAIELLRELLLTPGAVDVKAIENEYQVRMNAHGLRVSGSKDVADVSVYAAGIAHRRRTNHPFCRSPIDNLRVMYLHLWGWGNDARVGDRLAMGAIKLRNRRSGATYWHAVRGSAGYWEDLNKTDFASELEALACTREHVEQVLAADKAANNGRSRAPTWVRPLADTSQPLRAGFPTVNSSGRTELDLLSTFGFRGIEFGNWVSQAQRQWFVDAAFDAFGDLVQLLGVHNRFASLNGMLGLAYGSRGEGLSRSAAHFEPGSWVLHLTKESGPGSIAHEFAHAWDCWMVEQVRQRRKGLSKLRRGGGGPDPLDRVSRLLSECWSWEIEAGSSLLVPFEQWAEHHPQYWGPLKWQWVTDSEKMDSGRKRYWATPSEVFARGFETMVCDALALRGRRNDMLVFGVSEADGQARLAKGALSPYPLGAERAETCRLMAAIVRGCKAQFA